MKPDTQITLWGYATLILFALLLWDLYSLVATVNDTCGSDPTCRVEMESPQ